MKSHDRQFKQILTHFFFYFMELFFPEQRKKISQAEFIPLDKELFSVKLFSGNADLAVKTKVKGKDAFVIILVEAQAQEQKAFASRLHFYFAGLVMKYNLPVYPIVVFAYDKPKTKTEESRFQIEALGKLIVSFNYETVQLNQLDWRDFANSRNPLAGALIAKMKIAKADRPEVELHSNRIIVLSDLTPEEKQILFDFKNTYLTLDDKDTERYYDLLNKLDKQEREEIMAVTSSWELRGHRKGLEEGRAEGRRNEALSLLNRLLSKRFGQSANAFGSRLNSLSIEQLEELGEALFDFKSVVDLETWLDRAGA